MIDARHVLDEQDLSRLLLALLVKSTSPRRRTPPFRQTSSATSPVHGRACPIGESKSGLVLCGYGKRVYPKEGEYPLFNEIVAGRFFYCRKVFLNFGENRLTNFFLGI